MPAPTLIWSFREEKSKVNGLQAAGNSTGHALTMLALKYHLEGDEPFTFLFWDDKNSASLLLPAEALNLGRGGIVPE